MERGRAQTTLNPSSLQDGSTFTVLDLPPDNNHLDDAAVIVGLDSAQIHTTLSTSVYRARCSLVRT